MIERILTRERRSDFRSTGWTYPVASQLAEMARVYGFDGWLINIEKTFPMRSWSRERLVGFLEQLKVEVGDGNVIWYDALDASNRVHYQNSLTEDNLEFAKAAGSLLTNYAWTPERAVKAKSLALANQLPLNRIIFGIDIWAQDTQKTGPKRETWPVKGGGGTGTGLGVHELAKLGFSAGLFAPAWAVEHEYYSEGVPCALERAMWTGQALQNNEGCDCDPGTHDTSYYQDHPITSSALESHVGSNDFFFTDFCSPVGRAGTKARTRIGMASVLPKGLLTEQIAGCLQLMSCETGLGVVLDGNKAGGPNQQVSRHSLRLFDFSIANSGNPGISITINLRKPEILEELKISMTYHNDMGDLTQELSGQKTRFNWVWEDGVQRCFTGLSINVEGLISQGRTQLLELRDLCIMSQDATGNCTTINRGWIESTSIGSDHFLLLCWTMNITGQARGLPVSPTTGSVSYFIINGDMSRRVYATQCVLGGDMMCERGKEVSFQIDGYGFTGEMITSKTVRLRLPLDPDGHNHSTFELTNQVGEEAEDETKTLLFGERPSYRSI